MMFLKAAPMSESQSGFDAQEAHLDEGARDGGLHAVVLVVGHVNLGKPVEGRG